MAGTRGGRGVLLSRDELLVASYHTIHVLDHDLREKRRICNPLFANLHELSWDDQEIWCSSTDIDAALKVDLKTGETTGTWWPREDEVTASRFSLTPLELNKQSDNRTCHIGIGDHHPSHVHLNAVSSATDRPLALLNRFGSVIRLNPTEVVVQDDTLRGAHNILETRCGHVIVNNTRNRALDIFDHTGRHTERLDLTSFGPVKRLLQKYWTSDLKIWLASHGRPHRLFHRLFGDARSSRPLFVRGLCQTGDDTLLVGVSPASIIEVDWKKRRVRDIYSYSQDVRVCVHGLSCTA